MSGEIPACLSAGSNDALPDNLPAGERKMRAARLRNLRRLSDPQWERISAALPGRVGKRARSGNGRTFLEAVLWVAENQAYWLDIPKEFGDSHAVYIRFSRWAHDGVWPHVIDALRGPPELNARLSALVKDYIEARTLRQMRSSMKALYPGL
ncbi:MAG TPA: transposase [Pseudoxanthomonas sp.]